MSSQAQGLDLQETIKCSACNDVVGLDDEPLISCGQCSKQYHVKCLRLSREEIRDMRTGGKVYKCSGCVIADRKRKNDLLADAALAAAAASKEKSKSMGAYDVAAVVAAATPKPVASTPTAKTMDFAQINRDLAAASAPAEAMAAFSRALGQLQDVFLHMKQEMSEFTASLNSTKMKLQEIEVYKAEVASLRAEVSELRAEMAAREQRRLLNNVEITGVPEESQENLHHLVIVLSAKIGVELEPRDVEHVGRVGAPRGGDGGDRGDGAPARARPIVLRLARRAPRDQLLKAARVRRVITSDMLDIKGRAQRIYLNEHLTKDNRVLFSKARTVGNDLNFRYVWTKGGNILMRRTGSKSSPVIRIKSENDLTMIKNNKDLERSMMSDNQYS